MELWELVLLHSNGVTAGAYGSQEVLEACMEEWKTAMKAVDGVGEKMIEVHGVCDSFDRAPATMCFEVESVKSMTLFKRY